MFHLHSKTTAALALSLLGLTGLHSIAAGDAAPAEPRLVQYDVAMDGTSLHVEGPRTPSGVPAEGTPFVIKGYIYPAGTFARFGEQSGVEANGEPAFPELMIGRWVCRGWHLQDADVPSGVAVATNQVFDLDPSQPGAQTITTDGLELADFGVWFRRAITGGTGEFAGISGQQRQVVLGPNASAGFNTTFSFEVRGPQDH